MIERGVAHVARVRIGVGMAFMQIHSKISHPSLAKKDGNLANF